MSNTIEEQIGLLILNNIERLEEGNGECINSAHYKEEIMLIGKDIVKEFDSNFKEL